MGIWKVVHIGGSLSDQASTTGEVSQLPLQRLLTQYLDGTLKLSLNWGTGLSLLVPVFNDYGVSEL